GGAPAGAISFATRCTPAASTSTTATCAPSFANLRAPARPMPEAAAVTIPIFPLRRIDPPFGSRREGPILYCQPFKRYRGQRGPATACGILQPWRCREISNEVPEVRLANETGGDEKRTCGVFFSLSLL